jgi:hypothetical protein
LELLFHIAGAILPLGRIARNERCSAQQSRWEVRMGEAVKVKHPPLDVIASGRASVDL